MGRGRPVSTRGPARSDRSRCPASRGGRCPDQGYELPEAWCGRPTRSPAGSRLSRRRTCRRPGRGGLERNPGTRPPGAGPGPRSTPLFAISAPGRCLPRADGRPPARPAGRPGDYATIQGPLSSHVGTVVPPSDSPADREPIARLFHGQGVDPTSHPTKPCPPPPRPRRSLAVALTGRRAACDQPGCHALRRGWSCCHLSVRPHDPSVVGSIPTGPRSHRTHGRVGSRRSRRSWSAPTGPPATVRRASTTRRRRSSTARRTGTSRAHRGRREPAPPAARREIAKRDVPALSGTQAPGSSRCLGSTPR